MPKQQTDYLIQLIISLTKAEKRQFRLWVNRNQSSGDILFLKLFDLLDKQNRYDEAMILKKIPGIKKRQLSNIKAHLYKQLLVALRLLHRNNNTDIDLRERIDFARVLYNKGLYKQSLEILDKAKSLAKNAHLDSLTLEILDFEKLIESQYITHKIDNRAEELTNESIEMSKKATRTHEFSNLAIQLYSLFLKVGYVKNEKDYFFVKEFFHANLPKHDPRGLGFFEKIYLAQSYCWFHFMTQDFLMFFKYAQKWVNEFHAQPEMIQLQTPLYLKALHSLLNSLYMVQHYEKFKNVLAVLEDFEEKNFEKISTNVDGLLSLYIYTHRINYHVLTGTFTEGLKWIPKLAEEIEENPYNWDSHRIMLFNYRIASMYFSSGDFKTAIHYLNEIINQKNPNFREDIQCFARILCLIAHFELGNDLLIEYQVKSVYRFLTKMEDLAMVQKEILKFVRKIPRMTRANLRNEFILLKENCEKLRDLPYERRPFLYLDIIAWLESKIEGVPVEQVMRKDFLERERKKKE